MIVEEMYLVLYRGYWGVEWCFWEFCRDNLIKFNSLRIIRVREEEGKGVIKCLCIFGWDFKE